MLNRKKFTVGIVNYRSFNYMEYQLKILYEFNDPGLFNLIIVDNSEPSEMDLLDQITRPYLGYNNIKVIYNDNHNENFKLRTSSQHAEGLNIILGESNSDYLLVQDPDFFWIMPNYLSVLQKELDQGVLCIGAPYGVEIKTGAPDYPSAFGCAYNLTAIREHNLDFSAGTMEEKQNEHKYPGWKMRAKFSNDKYTSFGQAISRLPMLLSEHSYMCVPRYYIYNGAVIAYHLFRGSFVGNSKVHVEKADQVMLLQAMKDTRYLYSKYFYYRISGKNFSFIKEIGIFGLLVNFIRVVVPIKKNGERNQYSILILGIKIMRRLLRI